MNRLLKSLALTMKKLYRFWWVGRKLVLVTDNINFHETFDRQALHKVNNIETNPLLNAAVACVFVRRDHWLLMTEFAHKPVQHIADTDFIPGDGVDPSLSQPIWNLLRELFSCGREREGGKPPIFRLRAYLDRMIWKLLFIDLKGSKKLGRVSEVPKDYKPPNWDAVDFSVSNGGRLAEEPVKQELRMLQIYYNDTRQRIDEL